MPTSAPAPRESQGSAPPILRSSRLAASVTTIPAVANVGVAAAYREWSEVAGAMLQLGVNVAALAVAGVATLAAQSRAARLTHAAGA